MSLPKWEDAYGRLSSRRLGARQFDPAKDKPSYVQLDGRYGPPLRGGDGASGTEQPQASAGEDGQAQGPADPAEGPDQGEHTQDDPRPVTD